MKNYFVVRVMISLALISLFACTEKIEGDITLGTSFELNFNKSKKTTAGDIVVNFTEVIDDSRCPHDVECLWEGQAKVKLEVTLNGTDDEVVFIKRAGPFYENIAKDTVGGYVFTLEEVLPYPTGTNSIPQNDYLIKMKIEDL